MNQGNARPLKVFAAISLMVSNRILDNILRTSAQMNFVQELSGETCAFSWLTSPSSTDVVGFTLPLLHHCRELSSLHRDNAAPESSRPHNHTHGGTVIPAGVLASAYDIVQHNLPNLSTEATTNNTHPHN